MGLEFPGGPMVKNPPANAGDKRHRFSPWEDPLEEEWQPAPVLLPGESHGQRSLAGYSPWQATVTESWRATVTEVRHD